MSGSEQGGSVCKLAGTGQGQEVLGGGWEGARAASAPQLGRERCQHIPGAAGQRECVWAQGKCTAAADPPHCHPDGPTLPPGNLGPTVSPVMPQPPAASPRQDHPGRAVLPAQRCRPARVLSPGSCWTPWDTCPCTDSPSVPAPPEAPCMASPSALSFPKGSCSTQGAAHAQHFCSQGTSAGLGQEG